MFGNHKRLWFVFTLCMLMVFGVIDMLESFKKKPSGDKDILISIGSDKFKLDKRYLYGSQLKRGNREIKDSVTVDYFSYDFLYPELSWVDHSRSSPGWGNRISVYISNHPPFDFRKAISRHSVIGPKKSEVEFNSDLIKKYSSDGSKDSSSYSERNLYIYGDYEAYRSCRRVSDDEPPFPSCKLVFTYKNMQVSVSFSRDYMFEFLKIKGAIEELLSTYDITGVEK